MRACFLLWRLLERALTISSGVDLLPPFLFLSSHQQSPHLGYAHSWDSQECSVTIFHMPSQGRAWQESLPPGIWDRLIMPDTSKALPFPFSLGSSSSRLRYNPRHFPLLHSSVPNPLCAGILPCLPFLPFSLTEPSSPVSPCFPMSHAHLLHPLSLLLLLPVCFLLSPWKNLLKRWDCMCVSL